VSHRNTWTSLNQLLHEPEITVGTATTWLFCSQTLNQFGHFRQGCCQSWRPIQRARTNSHSSQWKYYYHHLLVGLFATSHALHFEKSLIYYSFLEADSSTYFSKTFFFLEGVNISSCRHNWFIKMTARKK